MGSEHYCLRWNNHQSNLLGVFSQLLESESLVDVTLACTEGPSIRAHKVVLSACSSYFQALFLDHPNRHPIVILKDVRFSELRTLVDFMYKGEVSVEYCQLSALLKTAESLKVKGLADMTNINAAAVQASRDDQQQQSNSNLQSSTNQQNQQHSNSTEGLLHQQQRENSHNQRDAHNAKESNGSGKDQQQQQQHQQQHRTGETGGGGGGGGGEGSGGGSGTAETRSSTGPKDMERLQQQQQPATTSDSLEAIDMTDSPATPGAPTSPLGPLALDRPRRDSEDTASLEETRGSISPISVHSGPSDIALSNNIVSANEVGGASVTGAAANAGGGSGSSAPGGVLTLNLPQSRLPSPHSTEPLAGPSGLPPVQQVPLSLKKEVDWDRSNEERSVSSEISADYRLPPDPVCLALGLEASGWGALVERATGQGGSDCVSSERGGGGGGGGLLGHGGFASLASLARRCGVCLATFPSVWLLERHALLQHAGQSSDDKPFTCDQCGQRYRYRSAYVKHREQNHRARLPADKLFTCDVCGMQFRYLKSFKKHRLNHALERLQRAPEAQNVVELAAAAAAAAASSSSPSSVSSTPAERSDQVSSTGEPPSQLEIGSGDSCTNPGDAEDHLRGTSFVSGSQRDEGVSETTSSGLREDGPQPPAPAPPEGRQESAHHPAGSRTLHRHRVSAGCTALAITATTTSESADVDVDVDDNSAVDDDRSVEHADALLSLPRHEVDKRERRFACPFCGKCVRSKENLKLHVRKHTGERPFVCLFCGRAFGGKSDLTRHLRIHTGERPYHCEMCGKCFARADYLSKHLTTHIHQR
ncbi:protein tramtrack, beta isoform isoform X1 [Prorops nasuta]|uniref:protein tramtrack, beta isoform isoform X1 n=1 Tax=Prorops nasuta TaxID=863751 RepID=UPI0034CE9136